MFRNNCEFIEVDQSALIGALALQDMMGGGNCMPVPMPLMGGLPVGEMPLGGMPIGGMPMMPPCLSPIIVIDQPFHPGAVCGHGGGYRPMSHQPLYVEVPEATYHDRYDDFGTTQQVTLIYKNIEFREIGFSHLKLGRVLGRGAFGAVHRGKWDNVDVAIKRLHSEEGDSSAERAFRKEIKILSEQKHPNIVRVYGYSKDKGAHYLVMEYLRKGSLSKAIHDQSQQISMSVRIRLSNDIAKGLNYLHQNGVIHLDLKPDNILLGKNWKAKISDFGLSKSLNTASYAMTMHKMGTPAYMDPCLVNDDHAEVKYSKGNDIYSLGVMFWEIATRSYPYQGMQPMQMLMRVAMGHRERIPSKVPSKFARLISKCWDGRRSARPSAEQVEQVTDELKAEYMAN